MSFWSDIDGLTWALIAVNSLFYIQSTAPWFAAFHDREPTKLEVFKCIPTVQQFLIDMFYLGIVYSTYPMYGFLILAFPYLIQTLRALVKIPKVKDGAYNRV